MAAPLSRTSLALAEQREAEVAQGFAFEQQGLRVLRDLSREEWEGALLLARDYAERGTWALGDLLIYGQRRGEWGQFYDRAIELTGLEYHTLSHKAICSRAYTLEQRVPRMSWSAHFAVLSLPPERRREALLMARDEHWGWRRLTDWVKTQERRPSVKGERNRGRRPHMMRQIRCPNCQHEWSPARRDWFETERPRTRAGRFSDGKFKTS